MQGSIPSLGDYEERQDDIRENGGAGIMRSGVTSELRAIINGGTVAGLTDGQLLERFSARRGEEAEPAFTALVIRHGPLVFGVCQSLLRNPHDAEDALHARRDRCASPISWVPGSTALPTARRAG
jgi:hypothetical protein